jgi:hypothetical protein
MFMKKIIFVIVIFAAVCTSILAQKAEKLKAEEIISKHLESIGTKEKRAEIKNQTIVGASEFVTLRRGVLKISGNAVFASEGTKLFFGANYDSVQYPSDRIFFDGDKVSLGFIESGFRSAFSSYMIVNKQIISEGLFGGCLTTGWSLFDTSSRGAKVKTAGKKKIDGKETYVLEYVAKKYSSPSVKLFFDAQTFQHVQTEYFQAFPSTQLSPILLARQPERGQTLTESFSSFSIENGLTLPHKHTVHLILEGARTYTEYEWTFQFSKFLFNQKLDPKSFDADAK